MEDISSPFEREVWTAFQGYQYIIQKGELYVLTRSFEEMDPFDKILLKEQRLAQLEPILKAQLQPLESQVRRQEKGDLQVPPNRFENEVNSQPPVYHMRKS